jgi:tetratricopeptide (TPR) repeat protein
MANTINEAVRGDKLIFEWLTEFTHRCATTLEKTGDEASNIEKHDDAVVAYSTALLLGPSAPDTVLIKWAGRMLIRGSVHEVLGAVAKFKLPRFLVYRVICDILEGDGRLAQAIECFRQMQNEDTSTHDGRAQWEHDFRIRCAARLEKLGDTARDSKKHDEAIGYYSNALSLDPTNLNDILLKRSNEVIELDPSSHRGYEGKHAALHGMGHHSEAFEAFRMMLSKLVQSSDPQIRGKLSC